MLKRSSLRFALWLLLTDLALTAATLRLSGIARLWLPWGAAIKPYGVQLSAYIYLMAIPIWIVVFQIYAVYTPQRMLRLKDELQQLVAAVLTSTFIFAGMLYFTFRDISRLQVIYFAILDLICLVGLRLILRLIFFWQGGHRDQSRRVLIVGAGTVGQEVAATIRRYAWVGLEVVGYLDDDPQLRENGLPVLGTPQDAPRLVEQLDVHEVVLALPLRDHERLAAVTYALQQTPVNIRVVPDYFNLVFVRAAVEDFGGMPLITLREPVLTDTQRLVKRAFDLVVGSVLTLVSLPLMGLITLAIRLDSPGPVIFKQQRMGENGRLFWMFKFRSMVRGAEAHSAEMIRTTAQGDMIHKHPDDPRVTRVGRFLRAFSLDELPQLFNVLKGDMTLVGPRPELPWLVDRYENWQLKRFTVPQGLTGWWQVNGRSEKPLHLHTEEDLFYIKNYSLLLDLKILWRTIGAVLRRRGAY
ncbi:MAG: sugar transferase [Chloroflexota bacterium]